MILVKSPNDFDSLSKNFKYPNTILDSYYSLASENPALIKQEVYKKVNLYYKNKVHRKKMSVLNMNVVFGGPVFDRSNEKLNFSIVRVPQHHDQI